MAVRASIGTAEVVGAGDVGWRRYVKFRGEMTFQRGRIMREVAWASPTGDVGVTLCLRKRRATVWGGCGQGRW